MRNGGLGTFTVITDGSSGVSADVHDRMPVWLQLGQVDNWMDAERRRRRHGDAAGQRAPTSMEACRVSRAVNRPHNDDGQPSQLLG